MPIFGTRILKAHIVAARDSMTEVLGQAVAVEQAAIVAQAVMCATDDVKQLWCVAVQGEGVFPLIYGPFVTRNAAVKALETGDLAGGNGARAIVLAMSPGAKRRPLTRAERAKREQG